jgi:hypothetical protein
MSNPLDRLRALWTAKPWTMPEGLAPTLDQCDFVYVAPPSPTRPLGMRLSDPTDASILLALAERRLMDLLPSGWAVGAAKRGGSWYIENKSGYCDFVNPDRLTALIAWAESEDCKQ